MADTTLVFLGIRLELGDDDIDNMELRTNPVLSSARKARLDVYWGNFGAPAEKYLLFVGKSLGKIGVEDHRDLQLLPNDIAAHAGEVVDGLRQIGVPGTVSLHVSFQPDE